MAWGNSCACIVRRARACRVLAAFDAVRAATGILAGSFDLYTAVAAFTGLRSYTRPAPATQRLRSRRERSPLRLSSAQPGAFAGSLGAQQALFPCARCRDSCSLFIQWLRCKRDLCVIGEHLPDERVSCAACSWRRVDAGLYRRISAFATNSLQSPSSTSRPQSLFLRRIPPSQPISPIRRRRFQGCVRNRHGSACSVGGREAALLGCGVGGRAHRWGAGFAAISSMPASCAESCDTSSSAPASFLSWRRPAARMYRTDRTDSSTVRRRPSGPGSL